MVVKKSSSFNCDIHDVVEMDTLQVERDLKIKEILNETTKSKGGFSGILLFLIFLVLKLTNQIDWSWWWVTSPLWIGFALSLLPYLFF
jgi:hypothetical protein